jgi:hypothetical protein
MLQHCVKFCRLQQPITASKPLSARQKSLLDSQTMAALGTARVNNSAATAAFHANKKAVGTLAAGNGRLIGTFHCCCLFAVEGLKSPEKTAY